MCFDNNMLKMKRNIAFFQYNIAFLKHFILCNNITFLKHFMLNLKHNIEKMKHNIAFLKHFMFL